ncbi:MAG: N-acetylmuramoyl-L-alanine amidase [Armatimonadota bacterium]|jgi:L-arabinokinase
MSLEKLTLEEAQERIRGDVPPRPIRMIIWHHFEVPAARDYAGIETMRRVRRYHVEERGWEDVGYNWLLAPDGDIFTGRSLASGDGAHTIGHNHDSVGLGMCLNADEEDRAQFPEMWGNVLALTATLCEVFGLTADDLYFHRDFSTKTCPGMLLDRAECRAALAEELRRGPRRAVGRHEETTMATSDTDRFAELCRGEARDFFDAAGDIVTARAPARIDAMGGIADYSGSVVLEGTLAEAAVVGLQPRTDDRVRVWSHGGAEHGFDERFELRLGALAENGRPVSYDRARRLFAAEPRTAWAAYLAGAFHVLMAEGVVDAFPHGANILLSSAVACGAGVSSSAAIEVAAMYAIDAAYGLGLEGLELARLCQIVENRVVGAPCGIMDQVTCALGQRGTLLALKCQPHEILGFHALPPGCAVFGINSNVKHLVGGSRYTRTRTAAFMGLRIITEHLGDDPYGGHLCNITPAEYRARFAALLPGKLRGSEFLAAHRGTADPVTSVDPSESYSVRACTEHPIYENARVCEFIERLAEAAAGDGHRALERAGRLMYASHWSYGKRCALGARETDLIVRLVRRRGAEAGLFGAKITGGGSGGTVAVLAQESAWPEVEAIAREYEQETGIRPDLFRGSSPGAYDYGCAQLPV